MRASARLVRADEKEAVKLIAVEEHLLPTDRAAKVWTGDYPQSVVGSVSVSRPSRRQGKTLCAAPEFESAHAPRTPNGSQLESSSQTLQETHSDSLNS